MIRTQEEVEDQLAGVTTPPAAPAVAAAPRTQQQKVGAYRSVLHG